MVVEWKTKLVEELAEKASKSKVIGLVSIKGIPSRQFQQIRKNLREKLDLRITRNNLIERAFQKAKLKDFDKHIGGSLGVVFTDMNPFQLVRLLESNKTTAPAKEGTIAEKDIIIPAGDTPFAPGPIIGELQRVGIKAKIEGGKIIVVNDSLVVKKGEPISAELASVLTRFGVEPREIGLEIVAAYENGIIYTQDVLKVNAEQILEKIKEAYQNSLNLALNVNIYTSSTVRLLMQKAYQNSLNLALNAEILTRDTVRFMLSKAQQQFLALSSRIPDWDKAGEKPVKEAKAEEPKLEEKAAEKASKEEKPKEPKPGGKIPEEKPIEEPKPVEGKASEPEEKAAEKASKEEKPAEEPVEEAEPEEKPAEEVPEEKEEKAPEAAEEAPKEEKPAEKPEPEKAPKPEEKPEEESKPADEKAPEPAEEPKPEKKAPEEEKSEK